MKQKNINYDYVIPTLLLRFLGACIYGNPVEFYGGLDEAERAELETQGRFFGMTAWFYRYLSTVLPEEKKTAYQKNYQARQVKALIGARELKRLYGVLASHGLRFAPIKGADLTYRLYPDAALRTFCDWDIWFHPDDCERSLEVLAEDGWKVPEVSPENHVIDQMKERHHFTMHVRGQYCIEPHFTLANIEKIAPNEMWNYTLDYPAGDGQRVLSPEMNLLMLTRHAALKSYYHAQLPKLLTDAAIVIQNEKVNFAELRNLSNGWDLPHPGNLLAAFPEFFPSDVIAGFQSDTKCADAFRQVFEIRGRLGDQENASLSLGRFESQGHIVGGVLKYICSLSPDKIRHLYHLPSHGAWGRVAMAYLNWCWTRAWNARAWWRNSILREYTHTIETAESGKDSQ